MDVTFQTAAGRRFTVEIWFFSTVRRIKEYVLRQEGISVESQRLFLAGAEAELDDDGDTERYSIVQGSTVLLLLPEDGAAPSSAGGGGGTVVRVVVSAPAAIAGRGGAVAVEVDPAACTVGRLKELIQERTDGALPAARVALMFGKVEMEDGRAVAQYAPPAPGLANTTVEVSAVVRSPPPASAPSPGAGNKKPPQQQQQAPPQVTVNVKWGAKAAAVEVSDLLAVKDLRRELGVGAAAQLALPNDGGYFFIYKQNVMEEDRTLRWHDVKNGDTVEIFNGRVTGGA
ncbi:uncharacterized protein LOC102706902 [Oryza brachyantha]|uniref:uncharacterized protein LOC102706902 n=1 Tax=Oryza brachyantha TaxID=4533 RepID=UPI001AD9A632|nr:uncharacterized protein LOC102706902 [Oryza brachyantha]